VRFFGGRSPSGKKRSALLAGDSSPSWRMGSLMAVGTQCNQVAFDIAAGLASELEMMHLEVLHATAGLAAPAVALKNLAVQGTIPPRVETDALNFADGLSHAVLELAPCAASKRNASRCGWGRNV
jgi:hypothetical protein